MSVFCIKYRVGAFFFLLIGSSLHAAMPPAQTCIGTNLTGINYYATERVFKDLALASEPWRNSLSTSSADRYQFASIDSLGYPTRLLAGQKASSIIFGTGTSSWRGVDQNKTYVLTWKGGGTFTLKGTSAQSKLSDSRIEFKPAPAPTKLILEISAIDSPDYLRDFHIYEKQFEPSLAADPFYQDFLDRWKNFKVIRFMDWMHANRNIQTDWNDRTLPQTYTMSANAGIAYESIIDYCNITLNNPWICVPHEANDAFVRNLATIFKDRLDPRLIVYLEYSNEVWNPAFGDNTNSTNGQYTYANNKGLELGIGAKCSAGAPWECGHAYYSRRAVQIFDIFEQVFGGTSRLVRVLSSQPVVSTAQKILSFEDAWQKADALAIHGYFGHPFIGSDKITIVPGWTADQLIDSCIVDINTRVKQRCADIKALLDSIKVSKSREIRMIAYEGGQHLAGQCSYQSDSCTSRFIEANRNPRMKDAYRALFSMWNSVGGTLFCSFSSVAIPSEYGSWGVLETCDQDVTTAPKYQALLEAMKAYPWSSSTGGVDLHTTSPGRSGVRSIATRGASVCFTYAADGQRPVILSIYSINGAEVADLNAPSSYGVHTVVWNRSSLHQANYVLRTTIEGSASGRIFFAR